MSTNRYYKKYLKYKIKYLKLKGGSDIDNDDFFLCFNTDKSKEILTKYENFIDTKLIDSVEKLNNVGAMSIVNILNYKNNTDDNQFKILYKTSAKYGKSDSFFIDNNFYEYANGLCINYIKQFLPNFIYTFNYTQTNDEGIRLLNEKKGNKSIITIDEIKEDLKINLIKNPEELVLKENLENACNNQKKLSLSLEFLNKSYLIKDLVKLSEFQADGDYNAWCLLFQIYATLDSLENIYTHNDLNGGNIMIKELKNILKIQYKLKNGNDFCIYTKYIPVFIDYGQNFVNGKSIGYNYDSEEFLTKSCYTSCNYYPLPKCYGHKNGLLISSENITTTKLSDNKYAKNRARYNKAQDLGYLVYFTSALKVSDKFTKVQIPHYQEYSEGPKSIMKDYIVNLFNEWNKKEWFSSGIINFSRNKNENDVYRSGQKTKMDILKQNISTVKDVYNLLMDIYEVEGFDSKIFETNETLKINLNIFKLEKWQFI